jgi:hypothetical protein
LVENHKHINIHKCTWSGRKCRSVTDYVRVNKKTAALVEDTRLYRGADMYTDHFLVVAKLTMPRRWRKNTLQKRGNEKKTFNVHLLKEESILDLYW